MKKIPALLFTSFVIFSFCLAPLSFAARPHNLGDFQGRPPLHVYKANLSSPQGINPSQIKQIYHLPVNGGKGTIAIIDAYDYPHAQSDLAVFSKQFGLSLCTTTNGCLEVHKIGNPKTNTGWETEAALDIEWAHAIAPKAKLLFIEAKTASGINLRDAITYAAHRPDVIAVSMSWGGPEFATETQYDTLFTSKYSMTFFASSGDSGNGVNWPAVSPNVTSVGGTTLIVNSKDISEIAWAGSGGGVSSFEKAPDYQTAFSISQTNGMRSVPDVAYNADPKSGYAIYTTAGHATNHGWLVVGGTSAAAPQWAAIRALNTHVFTNTDLYHDASIALNNYFTDILKGSNGSCGYYCAARNGYDFITGLGTPKKDLF